MFLEVNVADESIDCFILCAFMSLFESCIFGVLIRFPVHIARREMFMGPKADSMVGDGAAVAEHRRNRGEGAQDHDRNTSPTTRDVSGKYPRISGGDSRTTAGTDSDRLPRNSKGDARPTAGTASDEAPRRSGGDSTAKAGNASCVNSRSSGGTSKISDDRAVVDYRRDLRGMFRTDETTTDDGRAAAGRGQDLGPSGRTS